MTADSPMTHIGAVGASGLKSRATRGRNESQESEERTSIAAGQALLGVSEDLSAHHRESPEGKKSPGVEQIDWAAADNHHRNSSHLDDYVENTKQSAQRNSVQIKSVISGRESKAMKSVRANT